LFTVLYSADALVGPVARHREVDAIHQSADNAAPSAGRPACAAHRQCPKTHFSDLSPYS
jgi:hypothetical protein